MSEVDARSGAPVRRERRAGLVLTIALAVVVLAATSAGLLLFDQRSTGADALRTGGLAAGSVVALYALWLNDRRRRVEERRQELDQRRQELDQERYDLERRRQELEDRRTDHDRDRADDERFARAVELLGHEADQVRVGAMHALAGLARSRSYYTQTVLDVLCSYLRRPFDHPKWTLPELLPAGEPPSIAPELERERHARQTAQRLIIELLPTRDEPDPPIYDLDLTRAWLERFNLADRVVGRVAAYRCRFRHTTNFSRAVFHGDVHFRDSVFLGRIRATSSEFRDTLELRGIRTLEPCDFDRARFARNVDLKRMSCARRWFVRDVEFGGAVDLRSARLDGGIELRPSAPVREVLLDDLLAAEGSALPDEWKSVAAHQEQADA
ncbi:pentapeptide repeat-containing protein [Saccharopolyspora sp. NFXS83]|uniref:pentapeptide repeat-containing protein n=1 Tax=Saccharopolyspora sp. NFXS83 TaxID=2993560 RepID=UPI00224B2CF0|nr:pentapeptide repeat-containing protein [Saccharopolyspora sp. NFXS83]MCX2728703.1 pentapeptide repeat-containing protein [Saccharopolyspora sp. NFXS83]